MQTGLGHRPRNTKSALKANCLPTHPYINIRLSEEMLHYMGDNPVTDPTEMFHACHFVQA